MIKKHHVLSTQEMAVALVTYVMKKEGLKGKAHHVAMNLEESDLTGHAMHIKYDLEEATDS